VEENKDGQWVQKGTKPVLQLSRQQADRVGGGKCVFFVRVNPKGVSEKSLETDLAAGEIQGSALETFRALVADLYLPVLQEQTSWGKMPPHHTRDFLSGEAHSLCKGCAGWDELGCDRQRKQCQAGSDHSQNRQHHHHTHARVAFLRHMHTGASKVAEVLTDATSCLQGGVELHMPDARFVAAYELRPGAFNQAASDAEASRCMEDCLTNWCQQVRAVAGAAHTACADAQLPVQPPAAVVSRLSVLTRCADISIECTRAAGRGPAVQDKRDGGWRGARARHRAGLLAAADVAVQLGHGAAEDAALPAGAGRHEHDALAGGCEAGCHTCCRAAYTRHARVRVSCAGAQHA
jgi:hypothetical protein